MRQAGLIVGIALLALQGCAGGDVKPLTRAEIAAGSIFIIHIDDSDMAGGFEWLSLVRRKAGEAPLYYNVAVVDGYAYQLGLPEGTYQISKYGGTGHFLGIFNRTDYSYIFPAQGQGFKVSQRGAYYLGAWQHRSMGFFSGKFALDPVKQPSEAQALAWLKAHLEKNGDDAAKGALPILEHALRSTK